MDYNNNLVYFNCQGFLNNKDEIDLLIQQWKPNIVLLAETHVTSEIEPKELHVDGYRLEKCVTLNRRTGGVLALIREGLSCRVLVNQSMEEFVWVLSVELNLMGTKCLISVLYHPPNKENARFLDYFDEFLDGISDFEGVNIVFGDFNYDLSKPTFYGDKIVRGIHRQGFFQIVREPTRITERSQTLIDYIITNNKNLCYKNHLTPKISDHNILSVAVNKYHSSNNVINIARRNMRAYNTEVFQERLMNTEWDTNLSRCF